VEVVLHVVEGHVPGLDAHLVEEAASVVLDALDGGQVVCDGHVEAGGAHEGRRVQRDAEENGSVEETVQGKILPAAGSYRAP